MKLFSCVLALLLGSSSAYGLDLSTMQDMALENRQVIKRYMTSLEQSGQDLIFAKGGYYPSVDIGYTGNALDEASAIEASENSYIHGSIRYNLFSGFRDKYNVHSAEMLQQVEAYKLDGIRQDIQLTTALSYLAVYERLANKKVAESAFETLGKVYRDGESRYQVGLIGKNELLKFRVDYDNADITLKAAGAGLQKSVITLSREVGARLQFAELDFKDFQELPPRINRDDYMETMLSSRSEINALEAAISANDSRMAAEKGGYFPRLDVIGRYQRYDDEIINGNGEDVEDELRAQLELKMNLFQGYRTEATVVRAKLESRSLSYDLEELKDGFKQDLENLYIDFEVSLENVEVANRSIEQAEENLRITQLKYDQGLQRESDLLDAITSLSRAQYNYVAVVRTVFQNNFRLTRMIDGF